VDWKNKKVLVTGGKGMIGKELVEQLDQLGANVLIADLPRADMAVYSHCLQACVNQEIVFHLVGVKGSPKMTKEKPADFMLPMLQCDTNMIRAAYECGVKQFLYTSSIAVLNPQTDVYPAWAKQTAEKLIEAMRIQYTKGTQYCIVRPANVYGRFDNFDNPNAMVVTSLIKKALENKEFEVWGDGSEERDVVNAKDVARGMIMAIEHMPQDPVNLCSNTATQIIQIHFTKINSVLNMTYI